MRLSRVILGLVLLATVVGLVCYWRISPRSPYPVKIACGPIITRPQVVSSFNAALILAPDGTVWGWGANSGGLFGPTNRRGGWNVPTRLDVGSNWVAIAAGFTMAFGIQSDGSLRSWTFNQYSGAARKVDSTHPPPALAPGTNWLAVTAGASHGLALQKDGTLWAWGQNDRGQVGDGTTNHCTTPMRIGTNTNWTAIATGSAASLGLQSDGSLWQWGFVHAGYSAGGDVNLSEPTRVDAGTNWVAILACDYCFIARHRDNSLWVWGPNAQAFFASTNRQIPFCLGTDTNGVTAALGGSQLIAVAPDGTLCSWGDAGKNAMGRRFASGRAKLQPVGNRHDWLEVWAGSGTSFGLTRDGVLWTWGTTLGEPSRFSVLLEEVSRGLRSHHIRVPLMQRRQTSTATPWPLAQFTTNAISPPR